jgi:hypothetical protein
MRGRLGGDVVQFLGRWNGHASGKDNDKQLKGELLKLDVNLHPGIPIHGHRARSKWR